MRPIIEEFYWCRISLPHILAHLPFTARLVDKPKSVMRGRRDAGPTVAFPDAGRQRRLACTNNILVKEAYGCEQLV